MKLLALTVLIGYQILVSQATAQQNASQPERLHITRPFPPGNAGAVGRVEITASSIERDLSSRETETIYRLRGNVEVRMVTCGQTSRRNELECGRGSMVLHADAVDYNEKTGEIQPHGEVHITPFVYK